MSDPKKGMAPEERNGIPKKGMASRAQRGIFRAGVRPGPARSLDCRVVHPNPRKTPSASTESANSSKSMFARVKIVLHAPHLGGNDAKAPAGLGVEIHHHYRMLRIVDRAPVHQEEKRVPRVGADELGDLGRLQALERRVADTIHRGHEGVVGRCADRVADRRPRRVVGEIRAEHGGIGGLGDRLHQRARERMPASAAGTAIRPSHPRSASAAEPGRSSTYRSDSGTGSCCSSPGGTPRPGRTGPRGTISVAIGWLKRFDASSARFDASAARCSASSR